MDPNETITVAQRLRKSIVVGTIMVVIGILLGFC